MNLELVVILAILLILMTAFMFAPLGLGGGVLYVPIFLYLLEWEIHLALTCSLLLVWTVSLGSRTAHAKGGYAVVEIGRKGTAPSLTGAILGTLLAALFIARLGDMTIKVSASALLLWVLYKTVKQLNSELHGDASITEDPPAVEGRLMTQYRAGCFGGGVTSGFLGIGGGMIFMMLHRSLLGFRQHQAAGTTFILEIWMVPMAIITHLIVNGSGPTIIDTLGFNIIPIFLVVSGTAWLGARTAIKLLPQRVLTYPFIIAVTASLIRYMIDIREVLLTT